MPPVLTSRVFSASRKGGTPFLVEPAAARPVAPLRAAGFSRIRYRRSQAHLIVADGEPPNSERSRLRG